MPFTLITGGLFVSFFVANQKWRRRIQLTSFILLLLCSNSVITNQVFKLWEVPAVSMDRPTSNRTVGILLSGVIKKEKLPHDRVYFSEGVDRLTHTIQLYKAGKIQKIVITGGKGSFSESSVMEAPQLREVMLMCAVPPEDIIVESQSRNTRQNAVFTAEILKKQFPDHDYLLITSAFHMRRSLACFEKVGISTNAFSTDFKTVDYPPRLAAYIVPSPTALIRWHRLVREILGMIAYKFMGYI